MSNSKKPQQQFTSTVDFGRIYNSKHNQDNNPVAVSFRECLHNAIEHNAKLIQMFNFTKDNNLWAGFAHNGTPFQDDYSMLKSLEYNTTSGNGVQGSGGKAVMNNFSVNPENAEYIIHSKCQDGIIRTKSLTLQEDSQSNQQKTDKSDEWNGFLKNLLKEKNYYDQFTVIYIYRVDNPMFTVDSPSLTSDKYMNKLMTFSEQAQKWVQNGGKIHYNRSKNYNEKNHLRIDHRSNVTTKSMVEDFKIREFKIPVKDIEYNHNNKNISINAIITIEVFGNFIYNNGVKKALLSRQQLKDSVNPSSPTQYPYYLGHKEITDLSDYNSCGLRVYNDVNLGSSNSSRSTDELCYAENQKQARFSFDTLGASRPLISKEWKANHSKLKDYLGSDYDLLSKSDLDNIKEWLPNCNIKVELQNVKHINDIGCIDSNFYSLDIASLKSIISEVMKKGAEDRSKELEEYNTYISDFINIDDSLELLGYTESKSKAKLDKIYAVVEHSTLKKIPTIIDAKVKGGYLKEAPVALEDDKIQVKLYNDSKSQITDKLIHVNKPGLFITPHQTKPGVYEITIKDFFSDNGNKNFQTITESQYNNLNVNHFPKRKNTVNIDGKDFLLDFRINVPTKKTTSNGGKNSGGTGTGGNQTDKNIYFKMDNEECLVRWDISRKKLLLNQNNPRILRFAENNASKSDSFNRVYETLNNLGKKHFIKEDYKKEYDLSLRGNLTFEETYGKEYGFLLNKIVEDVLDVLPDVKKLEDAHKKYKENQEEQAEKKRLEKLKKEKENRKRESLEMV